MRVSRRSYRWCWGPMKSCASSMRPTLEVADIFRRHGEAFRRSHGAHLGRIERRVMAAIELCRTPALGGHEQCGDCGLVRCAYNSCLMGKSSNGELAGRSMPFKRLDADLQSALSHISVEPNPWLRPRHRRPMTG